MTLLHWIGETVREALAAIPLPVVRLMFLAIPVSLLIWLFQLPRSETCFPKENGRFGFDLRWGAALALLIQIVIYSVL